MSTLSISLRENEVSVPPSVRNAHRVWRTRPSLLLELSDGAVGARGEATPLPDYSPDTLERAKQELQALQAEHLDAFLDAPSLMALSEATGGLSSPSARFALEQALLGLHATRSECSRESALIALAREAGVPTSSPIDRPYAALLDMTLDASTALLLARQSGARAFKAKIGAAPKEELSFLRQLNAQLEPNESLRFDANGTFEHESDLAGYVAFSPEFVEEPLSSWGSPRSLGVPVALDETLWRDPDTALEWLAERQVACVVLKPMALGLCASFAWTAEAHLAAAEVVISHCFDGSVAFGWYQTIARVIGSTRVAMGLGPHPGLSLWSNDDD